MFKVGDCVLHQKTGHSISNGLFAGLQAIFFFFVFRGWKANFSESTPQQTLKISSLGYAKLKYFLLCSETTNAPLISEWR